MLALVAIHFSDVYVASYDFRAKDSRACMLSEFCVLVSLSDSSDMVSNILFVAVVCCVRSEFMRSYPSFVFL